MNDTDQYAQWDAAYVLGALSGSERAEYEEHLSGCLSCRTAVAELAGLPGLLGQLSPAEAIAVESGSGGSDGAGPFADPFAVPDPPASLMPRLPHASEWRQRWLAPMAAAAAALLIGGVGGYAVSASRDAVPGAGPSSTLAQGRSRLAFAPVSASPMTAVVDVVPTSQGTELRVECQYAQSTATGAGSGTGSGTGSGVGGSGTSGATGSGSTGSGAMTGTRGRMGTGGSMPSSGSSGGSTAATGSTGSATTGSGDGGYPGIRYAIWVVGRDGRDMLVKDWTARAGRVMHPRGVTPWSVGQIESIEIRLVDGGATVMRAQVG
ncbi:zf-HC2 domain-containing protein [Phycicoccus sp. Root101]|uniref:zf-HC2 domain-containing protein n=1 Tax=Phycicoccus sp. Root101 TaxID=1736421 RepID=UPI0007025A78|nr:zf-HC2 domain-containing protein [Phycicoccus sp. Root101]KQU67604.1 hypothetical protein ASC58_13820 [Phycicoccus sp. Root101]